MKYKILGLIAVVSLFSGYFYQDKTNTDSSLVGAGELWKFTSSLLQPVVATWNLYSPADFRFDGDLLPDGSDCSNGEILKKTGANDWDCATDATGSSGALIEVKDVPGSYNTNVSSVSFDGGKFTVTASGSAALVNLDWGTGGPASLSEAETISGNWVNTTNPWADNEVVDTLTINGGTVTWTDLTSYPTGCTNQFVTTVGDTLTCASVDISAMTNLSVTSPLTLTGDVVGLASNSLNFDEFVNSMTLDADLTIASATFDWDWGSTDVTWGGLATLSYGKTSGSFDINPKGTNGKIGIYPEDTTHIIENIADGGLKFRSRKFYVQVAGNTLISANGAGLSIGTDIALPIYLGQSTGSLLISSNASSSLNFEIGNFASASAFLGNAFSSVGDCNDATEAIGWTTTGVFNCRSVQDLDSTLTALAAYNTNGLLTQTAADTFTGRTITGTTNQITVSNGDGVSGNPTLSIPTLFSITAASLSGTFEVANTASISSFSLTDSATGITMVDCDGDTQSLGWDVTTKRFFCGDDDNSGGSSFFLDVGDSGGVYHQTSSVSFEAGHFTTTYGSPIASGSYIRLDWGTGGPASLSEAETISGNWVNTANPWADNEIVDTLTINGGTVTWTDLTSYPTGCTNQFVTTVGDTLTCASVDISAMTNLTAGTDLTLTGDDLTLDSTLTQNFTFSGTGSHSAAGEWNFDSNTFLVDSGTNRVGVGATLLTVAFEVKGTASASRGVLTNALNAGLDSAATVAYSRFGTSTTGHSLDLANDVLIGDDFEVDGDAFFDGQTTIGVLLGTVDAGGATSFETPNGANPTVDAEGEIAIDTSGFGQFVYYASGSVHTLTDEKKLSFSVASTSFVPATGSRSLMYTYRGITVKRMSCKTKSATSIIFNLSSNGTTDMDQITAATTRAFDDGSISNATVTKGNDLVLEWRTLSGEVDYAECTVTYVETRE